MQTTSRFSVAKIPPARRRDTLRCAAEPGVILGSALLLAGLISGCTTQPIPGLEQHRVDATERVGDFIVHIHCYRNGGGSFEIKKDGHIICRKESRHGGFYLGGEMEVSAEMGQPVDLIPGTDLTGEGKPDVVVTEYSGQMPLTYRDYIFELGDSPRLVGCIDSGSSPLLYNTNENGGYDIILTNGLAESEGFESQFLGGIGQLRFRVH